MTKEREALKLARDWIAERPADHPVSAGKMISIIDRALALPEMRPDEISTDELIYMSGRYDGIKQERALWELSRLGQEIEAQPEACQYAVDVAMPEYRCVGKCQYAAPLQRPWVGLMDEEVRKICVNEWGINEWGGYEQVRAIEAKLKEKNT